MFRSRARAGALMAAMAALVAATVVVSAATTAAAHEVRPVGAYTLTVGWMVEPTYVDSLNAVQIFIHDMHGNPVDDLGTPPTLQVTVSTGSKTSSPLDLMPSFDPDTGLGAHGEFDAPVVPTSPGTYAFHFTGSINGQQINQTFTSSDSTFDNVVAPTAIEFPDQLPSSSDLATNASRLTTRVNTALNKAKSAHDSAGTADTLAVVAIVIGAGLGAAGVVMGSSARRAVRSPGTPPEAGSP